ncbi:MAG: hypothetical protein HC810_04050 [Acaryochloridaceae cyanobacterium RL_2_7]|nr:hypothetical protein [Acaryochloridaceae cyanobacterium RL_2_7]
MTNFFTIAAWEVLAAAEPIKANYPYGKIYAGVLGLGFVAAVSLGSIAFYNSKRPVGWENKDRPNFVPKVNAEDSEN